MISQVTIEDMKMVFEGLSPEEKKKFHDKKILLTGYAGSIGYSMVHFFLLHGEELGVKKIYGVDNYKFGKPEWLEEITNHELFDLRESDIIDCDLNFAEDADYIFHMASLASPVYYRQFPIETMDADVIGIRRILDFYKDKAKSILFFSSSEIYGNPDSAHIPTDENYFGDVNCAGPRACYDESKRYGETLCYNYHNVHGVPVKIVRPFNNFGPGLNKYDQRVVADFAKNVLANEDIVIYSTGKDTRSFVYSSDALLGYLKCILYEGFDIFNIGSDEREITVFDLAEIYKKIAEEKFGYKGNIVFQTHEDPHYLTDNPKRRFPNINKARKLLNYKISVKLKKGVERYLLYLNEEENDKNCCN